jgi:mediator of replication checkpoint protein 1
MKQKKFAKMQKALLSDEKIGKIAENPKKQAFLRAIEDRGSEDETDFLGDFADQEDAAESQSQSQAEESQQRVPDSQPDVVMGPPKRKRSDDVVEAEVRPPPNLRRTKPAKKPSNISEIRESLSGLIEEPNQMLAPENSDSETDDDLQIEGEPSAESRRQKDKENRDPFALRRTSIQTVDRIALKRASSSGLSANARLAFATNSSAPGFKVPPLLRRATTNNSVASTSSTNSSVSGGMSATERMAGGSSSDGIKRGGGKNSGVNYFARESERKAVVMKTEKRREQKRFKGAEVRRKVVGGLFGSGKFE